MSTGHPIRCYIRSIGSSAKSYTSATQPRQHGRHRKQPRCALHTGVAVPRSTFCADANTYGVQPGAHNDGWIDDFPWSPCSLYVRRCQSTRATEPLMLTIPVSTISLRWDTMASPKSTPSPGEIQRDRSYQEQLAGTVTELYVRGPC